MHHCPFNSDPGDMRLLQPSSKDTADSTTVEALDRQVLLVPAEGAVQPTRPFHRVWHQGRVGRQQRQLLQDCGRECRRRGGVPVGR